MMNTKKLSLVSILSAIISFIMYSIILFQEFNSLDNTYVMSILFVAQGLFILAIAIRICIICIKRNVLKPAKIKKMIIAVLIIVPACVAIMIGIGSLTCRSDFSPENIVESKSSYVQSLFPYFSFDNKINTYTTYTIENSGFPGTEYFDVYSFGKDNTGATVQYEAELLKTNSLCMRINFLVSKYLNALPESVVVLFDKSTVTVNGVKVSVSIVNDAYVARISGFNNEFILSACNVRDFTTDTQEFAKVALEQYTLLKTAEQSNMFAYEYMLLKDEVF
ncbi:MAG: hypothetical protein ACI4WG_00520 [Erysipelotrichaceae bacterium]